MVYAGTNAVSEKKDTMAPTTDGSHGKQEDFRAHSFTRRRFFPGLTGLILIATERSHLIQGAWAADQEAADKPFNKELIEKFMRRAIELSRQGMEASDGGPFGAVVVKGEKIIGEGWNRVIVTKDPTAHGEVVAIRAATQSLSDFNLMCLGAIYWARIDRIYYANGGKDAAAIGFDDEFIYQQLIHPPHQRQVPEVQVLAEEAVQVFNSYAAKPDRVRY